MTPDQEKAENWWQTEIIEMEPGSIRFRGYAIQDLIGTIGFVEMIWLMLRGDLPTPAQAELLGAALVAGVDHGPQAPSIAIARMAMTCGIGINSAMASAVNVLGDVHGGAGEQALAFYESILARAEGDIPAAAKAAVAEALAAGTQIGGFGHRFHPIDPRAPKLLALVDAAAAAGTVSGRLATVARAVEAALEDAKGRKIPMNIDGATAVIFGELGFPAPLCRGLFILSRSVGVLAHAFEQSQQGGRNKGPLPKGWRWTYTGNPQRTPE
ncbi:citrate synthase [Elstera litoralis]|uniref:citrate synthase (unknown stereospecificity) n=1 Tax=Elstera litoralis TaxID=552518 RepID=A0A0F3IVQ6_9PROT|nr:citryl-CoA lyase [Elstera litoralis]KJV10835.1 citrate synthase [Elstera litoralis]